MAYIANKNSNLDDQENTGLNRNTSTVLSGNNQSGTAIPTTPANQFTQSKFTSANKILDRNKGVTNQAATDRIVNSTAEASNANVNKIKSAGQAYTTAQDASLAKNYQTPDSKTINNAITGDTGAYNSLNQILTRKAPNQVEAFAEPEVRQLEQLPYSEQGDYQQLLKKTAGSPYTSGMGALDMSFLNNSTEGQGIGNKIRGYQNDVDVAKAGNAGLTKKYTDQSQTAFDTQQTNLRKALIDIKDKNIRDADQLSFEKQNQDKVLLNIAKSNGNDKYLKALTDKFEEQKKYYEGRGTVSQKDDLGNYNIFSRVSDPATKYVDNFSPLKKLQENFNFLKGQMGSNQEQVAYDRSSGLTNDKANELNSISTLLGLGDRYETRANYGTKYTYDQNKADELIKSLNQGDVFKQHGINYDNAAKAKSVSKQSPMIAPGTVGQIDLPKKTKLQEVLSNPGKLFNSKFYS